MWLPSPRFTPKVWMSMIFMHAPINADATEKLFQSRRERDGGATHHPLGESFERDRRCRAFVDKDTPLANCGSLGILFCRPATGRFLKILRQGSGHRMRG